MHKSYQEEHSKEWGLQSKTITKLLMNGVVELWNDKEITTTLTVPGIVRSAVGRKIWSKILGKASLKRLVNKCGCFKKMSDLQQEANAIS